MAISKTLPRVAGLVVLTGVGVLASQSAANAADINDSTAASDNSVVSSTPDHIALLSSKYGAIANRIATAQPDSGSASAASQAPVTTVAPATTSTTVAKAADAPKVTVASTNTKVACVGSDAVKNVSYTIGGKTYTSLPGNVAQGAKVIVNFTVADNCEDTQIGLAAYQAPSNVWDADKADQQVLVDHQSGTFAAGTSHSLTVTAPSCDFQVDFFTGSVLEKLSATAGYNIPNGDLIDADNGGDNTCVPPVVTPPVTPPTTVTKDVCPTDDAARITSYTWTINGVKGFTTLAGNVKPGDKVEVDFTVAAGCDDEELSLASYAAPSDSYDATTVNQQVLIDSQTGTFGPGEHVLDVNVDACYYQVDFVHGGVITNLSSPDNLYNGSLIEAANGGEACVVAPPVTPPQVLGETITAQPAALAFTGSNTNEMVMIGAGLTLMGAALTRASARMRRNAA